MQAIRLDQPPGLDALKRVDEPLPGPPGAGEIQVRVHASSLNFHDLGVVTGRHAADPGRIPMSDGGCEVLAVGAGVEGLAPGDAVISTFFPNWQDGPPDAERMRGVPGDHVDGFACEVRNLPASAVTPAPRGWSHLEAATLPCAALTAWRALRVDRPVGEGDWVLVQGSGGVSVFALQLARSFGARVIATSSSDAKLARLREMGAEVGINYRTTPDWGAAAREAAGGAGVDLVIEVGGAGTLAQSIAASRIGGHIAMIGVLTGVTGEVPTGLIMAKQLTVKGLTVGSVAQQRDMVAHLETSGIRPVVDRSFPLAKLAEAFEYQRQGGHFGKICLTV